MLSVLLISLFAPLSLSFTVSVTDTPTLIGWSAATATAEPTLTDAAATNETVAHALVYDTGEQVCTFRCGGEKN
jgi:hypothetical protein